MKTTQEILVETKAALPLLTASRERKNAALLAIADRLIAEQDEILAANRLDVEGAKDRYGDVMMDRLTLTPERIEGMAQGVREVAALPDPEGRVLRRVVRPNGLVIEKTSVPLGVVAIIYESRPNVTSDAAVLALKSGNAVILRGGREAYRSNAAIVAAIRHGLEDAGLPAALVGFIEDTSHASADELMRAVGYVDLLIPRGGAGLIRRCTENAKVPCIQTGTGICHIFVDETADQDKAINIIENAKASRPSVCNAEEVLLVHRKIAAEFLPKLCERLTTARREKGLVPVELRLDEVRIDGDARRHTVNHAAYGLAVTLAEGGQSEYGAEGVHCFGNYLSQQPPSQPPFSQPSLSQEPSLPQPPQPPQPPPPQPPC